MSSTVDHAEVEKFSYSHHSNWWNEDGPFSALHAINKIRMLYIRNKSIELSSQCSKLKHSREIFNNMNVLDIGCGGGILSVPMARMGAKVLGIDASEHSIKAAKGFLNEIAHEELNILYQQRLIEKLCRNKKYDIVCAMEIIEHVANYEDFLNIAWDFLKPRGLMFLSSISRSIKSYLRAILAAEHLLGMVPKGTHQWNKFVKPSEIIDTLAQNIKTYDIRGISFDVIKNQWHTSNDSSVNYIICIQKE